MINTTGIDLTDTCVLSRPRGAAVSILTNSVTDALGDRLLGRVPNALQREPIASDNDVARLRFRADSPLRTTTGGLEAMALYAGRGVGRVTDVVPAAEPLRRMGDDAAALLARFRSEGCGRKAASHGGE